MHLWETIVSTLVSPCIPPLQCTRKQCYITSIRYLPIHIRGSLSSPVLQASIVMLSIHAHPMSSSCLTFYVFGPSPWRILMNAYQTRIYHTFFLDLKCLDVFFFFLPNLTFLLASYLLYLLPAIFSCSFYPTPPYYPCSYTHPIYFFLMLASTYCFDCPSIRLSCWT